jgi:hypothetical protein
VGLEKSRAVAGTEWRRRAGRSIKFGLKMTKKILVTTFGCRLKGEWELFFIGIELAPTVI